jgi:dimethylhistidine N-methyltransferase
VARLQQAFPRIAMLGLGLDFSVEFELPESVRREKRLFFYPGSSIGNFLPQDALALLRRLRSACGTDGGILIGVDLLKENGILEAAYDDSLGITAAFNLNLLRHLNSLLGSDFDVGDWRHRAFFNADQSRIEMHLEARCELQVNWPGSQRRFAQGERIHTENSYKYDLEQFVALLRQSGFCDTRVWTDAREWFAVIHARAET